MSKLTVFVSGEPYVYDVNPGDNLKGLAVAIRKRHNIDGDIEVYKDKSEFPNGWKGDEPLAGMEDLEFGGNEPGTTPG